MHKKRSIFVLIFKALVLSLIFAVCLAAGASGTDLIVPAATGQPGEKIEIPLKLNIVDDLAGIKLVIKYDRNILIYKKGAKTKHTASFMHVINDKKPGTLIAVMAAAEGISGKNLPFLILTFDVNKALKKNVSTKLDIVELQLMSDSLKEIKGKTNIGPITIVKKETALKPGKPKPAAK